MCRVADPHQFNADHNPNFHLHADPGSDPVPDPAPHESDANCDRWSTDTPGLHCVRPRPLQLHFEPLKLLRFDFNGDLDPALYIMRFYANADPDHNPLQYYNV